MQPLCTSWKRKMSVPTSLQQTIVALNSDIIPAIMHLLLGRIPLSRIIEFIATLQDFLRAFTFIRLEYCYACKPETLPFVICITDLHRSLRPACTTYCGASRAAVHNR